jgi:23S rRNA (guanosine2251-2'-O)-methyltransferase
MAQKSARGLEDLVKLAREQGIPVQWVEKNELDRCSQTARHQGIIALTAAFDYTELEEILARAGGISLPLLVLLDHVQDPYNLGNVLRTAEAAGAAGVIIPKRRAVGLTASVSRASAGALEYLPVARVANLAQTIEEIKGRGYWVVGACARAEQVVYEVNLNSPLALVIGGEDQGLSRLVREKCDFLVRLPSSGQVNSLNAANAAAILIYEALRQRLYGSPQGQG